MTHNSSETNSTIRISWGSKQEILVVIGIAILTGFLLKIPSIFGLDEDDYFARNISFIGIPALLGYSLYTSKKSLKQYWHILVTAIGLVCYLHLIPIDLENPVFILVYLHAPVVLWFLFGKAYLDSEWKSPENRINFIRFNGEVAIMGGLLLVSGLLFSGLTITLFELIDMRIEDVYFEYFGIWGIGAIPVLSLYLVHNNKHLVQNISPVIAKLFTLPAFVLLLIFSVMLSQSQKTIFDDREFLLVFNLILLAVMALILFSFKNDHNSTFQHYLLFGLTTITIIDNIVALFAIGYRLFEFGLSPNRLALFGLNLLMLGHIFIIGYHIFQVIRGRETIRSVFTAMGGYLPIYLLWVIFVIVGFPLIF